MTSRIWLCQCRQLQLYTIHALLIALNVMLISEAYTIESLLIDIRIVNQIAPRSSKCKRKLRSSKTQRRRPLMNHQNNDKHMSKLP